MTRLQADMYTVSLSHADKIPDERTGNYSYYTLNRRTDAPQVESSNPLQLRDTPMTGPAMRSTPVTSLATSTHASTSDANYAATIAACYSSTQTSNPAL